MVTANDQKVEQEFGIASATFQLAEPGKKDGGFDPEAFRKLALASGFSRCDVNFDWFLGQGQVMHGQSPEAAATVDAYLHRAAPLTNHLYKYLTFNMVK